MPKDDVTIEEAINNQIKVLNDANKMYHDYMDIIEGAEDIEDDSFSNYKVWVIQQKCHYLSLSLQLAKEHMNKWTWSLCCQKAVEQLKRIGISHAKNSRTVTEWYRDFRVN